MNDVAALSVVLMAGILLGAIFLRRSLVDGAKGPDLKKSGLMVFRQHAAAY